MSQDKGVTHSQSPVIEKVLVKIIVLGCSNVGKTSLMERFATGAYSGIRRPTIGSDFMSKKVVMNNVEVTIQIWDTAGQERFLQGSLGSSFYRGAHGALLVYDVTNESSFEQIAQWRDECLFHKSDDHFFPIVVIGNKTDLRTEIINDEDNQILSWCRDQSYGHIETSAKDGVGVEAAMLAITCLALEAKRDAKKHGTKAISGEKVDLNKMFEPKKRDCC